MQKRKKRRKNQMKKGNEVKNLLKNAKTVGAVHTHTHTHTHTQVVIKDREITQKHCVYQC